MSGLKLPHLQRYRQTEGPLKEPKTSSVKVRPDNQISMNLTETELWSSECSANQGKENNKESHLSLVKRFS